MENINYLLKVCKVLNKDDTQADLELIKSRLNNTNQSVIIPLIGEFSSGKTSLINALTDNKCLETASKATTATIFEVRFGQQNIHADILDKNNNIIMTTSNLEELKNEVLKDTKLVRVYDTSTKVPNSIVLVDTPGLSSNEDKHRQTLMSYLPYSDAILLTTDINQQITKSLVEFIKLTKLDNKPLFLIVTKCDTKTKNEIEKVKKYIEKETSIPLENIVCVSAISNQIKELSTLFQHIQENKNNIVKKALTMRVQAIKIELVGYIQELLDNLSSSSTIEESIKKQERHLRRIKENIGKLVNDTENMISESSDKCIANFRHYTYLKLENIYQAPRHDSDKLMRSSINTITTRTLNNYKQDIQQILISTARERQGKENTVPLESLESLDLSTIAFTDFNYNIELCHLGHKYDNIISKGVKVGAAVGVAVATVATAGAGGAAAGAGGAAAGGAAVAVGKITTLINKTMEESQKFNEILTTSNDQLGRELGLDKGIIEEGISWLTDKKWGKPQRRKAINNYISNNLVPDFKTHMEKVRIYLIKNVTSLLQAELENSTKQMRLQLIELHKKRQNEIDAYNQKLNQLKEFKLNLIK